MITGASERPAASRCRLRRRAYIANVEGQVSVRSAAAWCEGGLLGRAMCGEPTAGGVATAGQAGPPRPNRLLPCWMGVRCPHASRARSEDEGMNQPTPPFAAPRPLATPEAARGDAALPADTPSPPLCPSD